MARPTIVWARLPLKLSLKEFITGFPMVLLRVVLLEPEAITVGDIYMPIPKIKLIIRKKVIILLLSLVLIFIFTSIKSYRRLLNSKIRHD
jgi:hypothetical protein